MNITIIIPIFNSRRFLKECLDSVCIENKNEIEIILIDDGSTDDSHDVYMEYIHNHNFYVIRQENKGVSYSRNKGIEVAKGDWIMFVDSDDFLEFNWLDKLKNELKYTEYDMIIFSQNYNNKIFSKYELQRACLSLKSEFINCSIMSPFSKCYKKSFITSSNILFHNEVINGEDMLFNFEILLRNANVKLVKCGFYNYRKNLISSTNVFNEKIIESDILFHKYLLELVSEYSNFQLWENILYQKILNGLYLVFSRISLSKYKKKEYVKKIFDNQIYLHAINNYVISKYNNGKIQSLILKLIKARKYSIALSVINAFNILKNIYYKLNKDGVIKII
jgi:glycosyltransferase involved in cell wall biosynthesis